MHNEKGDATTGRSDEYDRGYQDGFAAAVAASDQHDWQWDLELKCHQCRRCQARGDVPYGRVCVVVGAPHRLADRLQPWTLDQDNMAEPADSRFERDRRGLP